VVTCGCAQHRLQSDPAKYAGQATGSATRGQARPSTSSGQALPEVRDNREGVVFGTLQWLMPLKRLMAACPTGVLREGRLSQSCRRSSRWLPKTQPLWWLAPEGCFAKAASASRQSRRCRSPLHPSPFTLRVLRGYFAGVLPLRTLRVCFARDDVAKPNRWAARCNPFMVQWTSYVY